MANETHNRQDAIALRVCGLMKEYVRRPSFGGKPQRIVAADSVTFDIPEGKILGLIGSSGSGKSTVARCITRMETPDDGEVWIGGTNIAHMSSCELRAIRKQIQMIFQDPATAMNPRFSAAAVIEEPLLVQGEMNREDRQSVVRKLMEEVGLNSDWAGRRAAEFSGGQKQRLAIARALAVQPRILILDEALSGLDLSTQAQIANLLLELQASHALTYLLISHDMKLVGQIADTIAVMAEGKIVEQGPASQIFSRPVHEETRRLLDAAARLPGARVASAGGPA